MIARERLISMVRAVQNGEEAAATTLYDTFYDDVYYHIMKTVKDPDLAADLTQDTFLDILQNIGALKEPAAFITWSRQVAYHRCTAHFRKRKELLADENEDGYSVFDTLVEDREEFIPDEALDKEELKQSIHAMIDELPEEQRSAILMRYFDEISVKEIAEIQGVSEGTVKSRLNYGRKAIKQSVEEYEKKHQVKLHCAGVVPLLLWLFRGSKAAEGLSFASQAASAAATAAETASATSSVAAVAETGAKIGAKAASTLTTKIIAGVAAAAVTVGGIAAVVVQPEPIVWCGYGYNDMRGIELSVMPRRFEMTVDEMDDEKIRGHLEVSYLYDVRHETEFEGQGQEVDGKIEYDIVFETPASVQDREYAETTLKYDKETDTFVIKDFYRVEMKKPEEQSELLVENEQWSGRCSCRFCPRGFWDHTVEIYVYAMSEAEISGRFVVLNDGVAEHESEFSGRGYAGWSGDFFYEIKLDTVRTKENAYQTITSDRFWIKYDVDVDDLESYGWGSYPYWFDTMR